MKKSIITMLVLPWLLCTFVIANVLLPKWQSKSAGDKQLKTSDNKPEISKYGNLLEWSGTTFHDESYELRYEYVNPHTRKKTEKIVSVFGNKSVTKFLPVEADSNSQPANTKKVSMKTADGVLTLTRLCTLNEDGKVLDCRLKVRNDSKHPVNLRSVTFRISALARSVNNDSRRSAKTPPKSGDSGTCKATQSGVSCCGVSECFDVGANAGTDCDVGDCNPPKTNPGDRVSYPPTVNIAKASLAGRVAITYSWVSGRNMPSKSLRPGQVDIYFSLFHSQIKSF